MADGNGTEHRPNGTETSHFLPHTVCLIWSWLVG